MARSKASRRRVRGGMLMRNCIVVFVVVFCFVPCLQAALSVGWKLAVQARIAFGNVPPFGMQGSASAPKLGVLVQ